MGPELFWLSILAAALALWWNGLRARERASDFARRRCQEFGVIFLDDTVTLRRVRPRRHSDGRIKLFREYAFEFTGDGNRRVQGLITVFGGVVVHCEMDAYPLG